VEHLQRAEVERFTVTFGSRNERSEFPVGWACRQSSFDPRTCRSWVVRSRSSQSQLAPERPVDTAACPLDQPGAFECVSD